MATHEFGARTRELRTGPEQTPERAAELPPVEVGVEVSPNPDHPTYSDDAAFADPEHRLVAVFDGMSQPRGGDVAATVAREHVQQWPTREAQLGSLPFERYGDALRSFIEQAHGKIKQATEERAWRITAGERLAPLDAGIGATAVVVKLYERPDNPLLGRWAFVAWIGDSRAELHKPDGSVQPLTVDDRLRTAMFPERKRALEVQRFVDEVVDPGKLTPAERARARKLKLEPEQVKALANDYALLAALGGGGDTSRDVHVVAVELKPGERIAAFSDGGQNATLQERSQIVRSAEHPQQAAAGLVGRAREKSLTDGPRNKHDDAAAAVIEAPKTPLRLESLPLKKGMVVPVRHGENLDDGWTIRGFNEQTGDVVVEKPYERGTMQKHVRANDVRATLAILSCRSFTELAMTVRRLPDRQLPLGAVRNRATLVEQLTDAARNPRFNEATASRAFGFRRKVQELRARAQAAPPHA